MFGTLLSPTEIEEAEIVKKQPKSIMNVSQKATHKKLKDIQIDFWYVPPNQAVLKK